MKPANHAMLVLAILAVGACANIDTRRDNAETTTEREMLAKYDNALQGQWSGSFNITSPTPEPVNNTINLCVQISGSTARVFTYEHDKWGEIKPGQFQLRRYGPSAIIYAIGGGQTQGGGPWVESWSLSITYAEENGVLIDFGRVVNNVDVALGSPDGKYSFAGEGMLRRSDVQCG